MQLVRNTVASIMVGAVLVLGGCAGAGGGESQDDPTSTPGAIEVEEDLLTVDITIARSLLDPTGDLTDEEIVSAAEENEMVAVVDGESVVYTMTNAQRDEMLEQLRVSAQQGIDDVIADDSNSITGVEFDESMESFQISVDADRFAQLESLLALGFYVQGALYQQFNGVSSDDIDVIVEFVDDETGEVLQSGSYQDMRENLEQQSED